MLNLKWLVVLLLGSGTASWSAPMDLTRGNDVSLQVKPLAEARKELSAILDDAAKIGVTSFEPYVKWMLLEPEEGKWNFTYYDMVVDECTKHGMKWTPFLIAGPAYSTPQWFKDGKESVFARCLEHGKDTRTQSIWNPAMPRRVDLLMKAFADHFDTRQIQSLLLGISGDFGESIYTVSGNAWTYIWDGEYHQHRGWWCGDVYAENDFRAEMKRKYRKVDAMNVAWKSSYATFEAVKPFLPDTAPSRTARLDMVRWYRGSMTRYAEMWLQAAKRYMPRTTVMLCTGGEGVSVQGADFTGQAIMAARNGCGMRITNEASNYGVNFMLTRLVGSACRNLGTYFGYEPAGEVTDNGVVARFYNAVASGANELFVYDAPAKGPRSDVYRDCTSLLFKRQLDVKVAMFYCKTSEELGVEGFSKGGDDFYSHAADFRDYADFDFLDESLIAKGFLNRYNGLVWMDGAVTDATTLKTIQEWTKRGGHVFLRVKPESVDGKPWKMDAGKVPTEGAAANWYKAVVKAIPALFPDGKADGLYLTTLRTGVRLLYNSTDKAITLEGTPVEPHTIQERRRAAPPPVVP